MIGRRIICLALFLSSRQKKNAATATVESRRNNGCLPIYANIPKSFVRTREKPAMSRSIRLSLESESEWAGTWLMSVN